MRRMDRFSERPTPAGFQVPHAYFESRRTLASCRSVSALAAAVLASSASAQLVIGGFDTSWGGCAAIDEGGCFDSVRGAETATTALSASDAAALQAFVARGGAATLALDNDSFAGPLSDAVDESFIDWIGIDIGDTGNPRPQTASVSDR
jgi:hypothetical protein